MKMPNLSKYLDGIFGVGVDLVDSRRIERALHLYPNRFAQRIFTSQEIVYCQAQKTPALAYAKRFAAKEAFAKAAGLGIGALTGAAAVKKLF